MVHMPCVLHEESDQRREERWHTVAKTEAVAAAHLFAAEIKMFTQLNARMPTTF